MQIEAHSDHTNLLSLPIMLRARLPLQSNAVITIGGQANTNEHSESADRTGAIRSNYSISCLEALEGVAIHITFTTVNTARIAVLFR